MQVLLTRRQRAFHRIDTERARNVLGEAAPPLLAPHRKERTIAAGAGARGALDKPARRGGPAAGSGMAGPR